MSLVNDMLNNLQERHGGRRAESGVFAGLTSADQELTEKPDKPRLYALVLLLVVSAATVAAWLMWPQAGDADPVIPQVILAPEPVEPLVETMPAPAPQLPSLRMDDTLTRDVAVRAQEPVAIGNQPGTDTPPARARLTDVRVSDDGRALYLELGFSHTPEYRRYLLSDPDRLVLEIPDAELSVASSQLPEHEAIRAIRHSENDNVFRLVFDLQQELTVDDEQLLGHADGAVLKMKLQPRPDDSLAAADAESTGQESTLTGAMPEPIVVNNESMRVRPSEGTNRHVARDAYQLALRDYQQRNYPRSIARLEKHLADNPDDRNAMQLYALALINAGQLERAERHLYDVTQRMPDAHPLKQIYARLLMDQKRDADALAIMYISPPPLEQSPEYHALLAVLLQELEQHAEAAALYRRLVQVAPEQGVWWMGLGISLEATGQNRGAKQAYQRALDSGRLSPDLNDFVTSKIRLLSESLES